MRVLKPVLADHADDLFPHITTEITKNIQWSGPSSLNDFKNSLKIREDLSKKGEIHAFTILHPETGIAIGSIDIRPDDIVFRATVGLWLSNQFKGKGFGSQAVKEITRYGFETIGLRKIEANIFVGNFASKRIFEKNNYILEGTIRNMCLKDDIPTDEWVMGIVDTDFSL